MDFHISDDNTEATPASTVTSKPTKPIKGPLRTNEANAVYAEIMARHVREARKASIIQRSVGALALIALPFCLYYFGPKPWTYLLFFGWMLAFAGVDPEKSLNEKEYYSIPGSRDKSGKHRCIYCGSGAKEIHHWGRTYYNETIYCASCGKCAF